ncbi:MULTISPECIES: P-loop NTPase fold protein [unclassified Microcoleus]|jgi:energy-coupling factor transporter ATP-binding protein EcfA2|uniref:P-loop NTPase fold protein n=1 Tax=unclassified Microcoleus TaxID=2642155 RepID=UPI001D340878|nr:MULTISPECIES: P-loop NTPase fold protein [unclassified Microcoleus]TAE49273.1 MAG: ATP-binding protein [Oscillatoriales cyanobacterium]TAF05296.1 MAG: ATP-binding protein [Nostocales cyanobacterium]MCC3447732.1 AAA family ATPase [Microcoleus sp. PH2017_09_SFU_O_A]MCC3475845.1 AAA family ATPase [Microcoleus sp. PH2017_13_LAR_U_A]MCC3488361.1 AAA family ATPase [Microcoleus sp. PH2017_14_LAR_D_A]
MTSLPPNRAKTLKEAYRACDVKPLAGDDIARYYVDLSAVRNTVAIENVSTDLDLQEPGEFNTILFTGHRGCGKSTELKRIQSRWENEYRVIYIEFDQELDVLDAEYTDLYLLVIKKVADELTELGLKFDPKLLHSFELWFKEVTKETEETVQSSVSIETEASAGAEIPFISKLMAKLIGQIRGSSQHKQVIRETLQRNLSRLQTDMNLLLKDAFDKLIRKYPGRYQKGFLLIVDNLDRITPRVANHLFFDYAPQLQELDCTIIYTVPISVIYSYKNVSNLFDSNPNIVPMVNIYEFNRSECDLNCNQQRLDGVASLIEKRVDVSAVFDDRKQLLDLAKASGGHVRQLMQITRSACRTAITRKHNKVLAEDVTYALNQQQFDFERSTPTPEYYTILARVCIDKDIAKEEIGQNLLFNLSVLEYNGNSRWNYVNPLVKQSYAFQQALASIQGNP